MSDLVTVPVFVVAKRADGSRVANARVRFSLTVLDVDGQLVVPHLFTGTTDDQGEATVDAWPNTRGVNGSQYRVEITGEGLYCTGLATVPESPCNLHDILALQPPPAIDDAKAAAQTAQAAASRARAYSAAPLFTFTAGTEDAAPGAGRLLLNSVLLAAATFAYVDVADLDGNPVASVLEQLAVNSRVIVREGDTGRVAFYRVTAPVVEAEGYRKIPIAFVDGHGGAFTDGKILGFDFVQASAMPIIGTDKQVIFNDQGAGLAGDAGFTFDKATGVLSAPAVALGTAGDALLYRDAANALALRNGPNSQMLRVYGTYTDAGNYERGFLGWTGSVLQIGTDHAGTGAARAIRILTGGINRWQVAGNGHISAITPNAYDLAGARTISAETSIQASNQAVSAPSLIATGPTADNNWGGVLQLKSSNGVVDARLISSTNGLQMQFGGAVRFTLTSTLGVLGVPLELRDGATAQTIRAYRTYTDASNYERGVLGWDSIELRMKAEAAGTGLGRNISLWPSANLVNFRYGATGTTQFSFHGGEANNAHMVMRPTGILLYSILEMQGLGGDSAAGMTLQAGQGTGWIGANTLIFRKRDNTHNYLVLNGTVANFGVPLRAKNDYTVATLPAPATVGNGAQAYVTDANQAYTAASLGVAPTSGGTNHVPVCVVNGAWVIG